MTTPSLPDIGPATDQSIKAAITRLQACANAGLFRHAIDAQIGGHGDSFASLASTHEALGKQSRDPGLLLALNAHIWGGIATVMRFGDTAQKSQWLPALLSGEIIGGHAITEPHAGSNVQMIETRYHDTENGYILNGHKRFITNTPIAGMMIVYAKQQGSNKICAFIITPEDKGADFLDAPAVNGCATASMGDIILSDCFIPKSRLLGKPGAGSNMIQLALERERAFIFAGVVGVMQWQLEQVLVHAKNRMSGAANIGQHQAISHKIADMKLRLDSMRLWITRCADLLDAGKRITIASAETKLYASEAFLQSSLDAIHILGASGLSDEFTRLVDDAMAGKLMAGSSEIQKNIIAAMLGLAAT